MEKIYFKLKKKLILIDLIEIFPMEPSELKIFLSAESYEKKCRYLRFFQDIGSWTASYQDRAVPVHFKSHVTLRKLYFHFLSHWMGCDRGDSFPFDFEPNGNLFGSKSKWKLSPRSYPIQCERKWKYSFLSVTFDSFTSACGSEIIK